MWRIQNTWLKECVAFVAKRNIVVRYPEPSFPHAWPHECYQTWRPHKMESFHFPRTSFYWSGVLQRHLITSGKTYLLLQIGYTNMNAYECWRSYIVLVFWMQIQASEVCSKCNALSGQNVRTILKTKTPWPESAMNHTDRATAACRRS
jgi:hypothetical protein